MAKKDKFAQMQHDGVVGSFQESLVQAAATVAAIERQGAEQGGRPTLSAARQNDSSSSATAYGQPRFMRLPNPQIPLAEYNMVSQYCNSFANMTRQDFVELAIIEKLHNDGSMPQEDFSARRDEIRNRPPRGQRKGTKQTSR